ncbi:MAG: SLATT domain-containing protein [Methyloversatilis sp.]|uniref:SLATT domain-containing protein n=1 Tax=Methyloversatilis sp. TaxID=2569862 RepID=UPI0027358BEB|nr:SLATT domain-containing protein [Methyloversatilis sp.]MDP3874564.1 SLATT domain-containing protein [Methyloversatilis sp.]
MQDNVWFTYKARIQAAQRLSRNDFHSQALLVWYAFFSAALAVVTVRYPKLLGSDTDLTAAVLAVGLLVMSMFVTSQDFRGRSIAMRSNYLALHALHNALNPATPTPADIAKYAELLAAVENHTEMDDKRFRVFHGGQLTRPSTYSEALEVYAYLALRAAIFTLLYVAPFGMLLAALR